MCQGGSEGAICDHRFAQGGGGGSYRVAPQTGVQIHFIKDGLFVNFKSSTSVALAQPNGILIIEYPRTFDLHNLRKFERFKTNIPVTFFCEEGDKKFEDLEILRDLSSGRALISHTKEATKQKPLYLSGASYSREHQTAKGRGAKFKEKPKK